MLSNTDFLKIETFIRFDGIYDSLRLILDLLNLVLDLFSGLRLYCDLFENFLGLRRCNLQLLFFDLQFHGKFANAV